MIRTLFLFLLFFSILFCFSQEKQQDSLLQDLEKRTQIDSVKVILNFIKNDSLLRQQYNTIFNAYKNSNPSIHYHFIKEAFNTARLNKDTKLLIAALLQKGIYFRKKGLLDSSIVYYKKAIAFSKKEKDSAFEYSVKLAYANVLKAKGNFPEAIKMQTQVISFFERKGAKYHRKAIISKFNLAGIYMTMKDWKKAEFILDTLSNTALVKQNKRLLGSVCINLVGIKSSLNKFDEALKYAGIAEKNVAAPRSLSNLYNNIGIIYENKEQYKTANDYHRKSLKKAEMLKSKNEIIRSLNNIGNNYIKWGKLKEAETFLLQSKDILEQSDNIKSKWSNYEMLSTLYERKKEYNKAFIFLKKEQTLKDTILSSEKQKYITEFETKYETHKITMQKKLTEKQALLAQEKSDRNFYYFIGTIVIAGLILLASLFFFGRLRARKKAELITIELKETQKRLAIEKQYRESELKALKSQMNPHFIFNVLNSIQEYIILNKKNLASDYLGKFADLIRTYLHYSNKGIITIQEEIDSLKQYLELETLRFEDSLSYSFKIAESLDAEKVNIPTMLIQPYIENALKHGLLHKKKDRKLHISFANSLNNNIVCVVEDNGIGRKKSQEIQAKRIKLHPSFATKATQERLELLNYGKNKKIGVEIIDLYNDEQIGIGTKVILSIPTTKV